METYRGIQGVDITTVGFLSEPERAFAITHDLNNEQLKDNKMAIELMHPLDTKINRGIQQLSSFLPAPYNSLLPKPYSLEEIRQLKEKYHNARLSHVHLPFRANQKDAWKGFLSYIQAGEKRELVLQAGFLGVFGTASNMGGIALASELGIGINAHPNVIENFAQNNQLDMIKKSVPFVFVESTMPGPTYLVSRQEMSDPHLVAERAEKFKLSGIIFGLDHFQETQDVASLDQVLDDVTITRTLQRVHLASPDHGHLDVNDQNFNDILHILRDRKFKHPVRVILDMREEALAKVDNVRDYILKVADHIMQHAS